MLLYSLPVNKHTLLLLFSEHSVVTLTQTNRDSIWKHLRLLLVTPLSTRIVSTTLQGMTAPGSSSTATMRSGFLPPTKPSYDNGHSRHRRIVNENQSQSIKECTYFIKDICEAMYSGFVHLNNAEVNLVAKVGNHNIYWNRNRVNNSAMVEVLWL